MKKLLAVLILIAPLSVAQGDFAPMALADVVAIASSGGTDLYRYTFTQDTVSERNLQGGGGSYGLRYAYTKTGSNTASLVIYLLDGRTVLQAQITFTSTTAGTIKLTRHDSSPETYDF